MDIYVVPRLEKLLSAMAQQMHMQYKTIYRAYDSKIKNGTARDSTIMEPVARLFQTLSNASIILSILIVSSCSDSF